MGIGLNLNVAYGVAHLIYVCEFTGAKGVSDLPFSWLFGVFDSLPPQRTGAVMHTFVYKTTRTKVLRQKDSDLCIFYALSVLFSQMVKDLNPYPEAVLI